MEMCSERRGSVRAACIERIIIIMENLQMENVEELLDVEETVVEESVETEEVAIEE